MEAGTLDPGDHLFKFVETLAPAVRIDLSKMIVRHWMKNGDALYPEEAARSFLQGTHTYMRQYRTIDAAGLIDHLMVVRVECETLDERYNLGVDSLSRQQWRAARPRWLALRAGELSPVNIENIELYRPRAKIRGYETPRRPRRRRDVSEG